MGFLSAVRTVIMDPKTCYKTTILRIDEYDEKVEVTLQCYYEFNLYYRAGIRTDNALIVILFSKVDSQAKDAYFKCDSSHDAIQLCCSLNFLLG